MTRIGDFQGISQHSSNRIVVDDQGKVSTSSWKGSAVSFLKGNFKAENNRAKEAFVKSMKYAYGAEVANQVALKLNMHDGKPLKMRQVKQLLADHVNIQRQPTPLQKGDINQLLQANGILKGGRLVLTEGDYGTLNNLSLSVGELKADSPVLDQIVMTSDERLGQLIGDCLKEARPSAEDIGKIVKAIRNGCPNYIASGGSSIVLKDKVYGDPKVLAEGAHGKAVRYTSSDGSSIVVKFPKLKQYDDADVMKELRAESYAKARAEVQTHRYANDGSGSGSERVAKLIAPLRTDDGLIAIVLENCELGAITSLGKDNGPLDVCQKKGLISPEVAKMVKLQIASQMLQGMTYLHNQRNLLHLDLKPDNVFLDSSGTVKIADFGEGTTSRTYDSSSAVGTPQYTDPQWKTIGKDGAVDGKVDAYSVGVSIYELMTGKKPFWDILPKGEKGPYTAVQNWFVNHKGLAEGELSTGDKAIDDIINALTDRNASDRLSYEDVANLPAFNAIKSYGAEFPELQPLAALVMKRPSLEKAVEAADPQNKASAQQALADLDREIQGLSLSVSLR